MMLKADHEPDRSEFVARVPLESCDLNPHSNPQFASIPRVRLHQHRILLVDDEIVATTTRAEILRASGYAVDVYHSPLAMLRSDLSRCDLAIIDLQMPEMNGRELLLRVRELGAQFPIMLLTGSVEVLSNEECAVFARCISKGMSIRSSLDTIADVLDRSVDGRAEKVGRKS